MLLIAVGMVSVSVCLQRGRPMGHRSCAWVSQTSKRSLKSYKLQAVITVARGHADAVLYKRLHLGYR